ncbi:MAG: pyridoxal phosphate-dependent aminotransferase [Clostridia bacterium]|nr:pyridoxal phosphate-dependent aminotransferase [Clostridia bacterium]
MRMLGEKRSAIRELFEYGKELKAKVGAENVFDFSIGNPSAPVPDCVIESIKKHALEEGTHNYTSAQGDLAARKAVADYMKACSGVNISADDIYITCGASAALSIVFCAINGGNGEFITMAPHFPEYKVFVESSGGTLTAVPPGKDFKLNVEGIENAVNENTCGVIINSPNNPVGNVYSAEEIAALANALKKKELEYGHPIYIISDEPYREITYGAEAVNPMLFYPDVILCYSFSKTLSLAGERIGYIAVSPDSREKKGVYAAICGAGRALGYVSAPSLFQRVLADCIGKTSDFTVYQTNRYLMYNMLKGLGFECVYPEGAFYLFVKCPCEENKFFEECKKEGVLVVPSESFGYPGYVRIAYCVPTDTIVRARPHFEKIAAVCVK